MLSDNLDRSLTAWGKDATAIASAIRKSPSDASDQNRDIFNLARRLKAIPRLRKLVAPRALD
jgi:hypothetical protein